LNIFALDAQPCQAAKWHCDVHVVKMVVETAQLLCGVHHATGGTAPYRATHINHPCAVWTRASRENYQWLAELGRELSCEYTARYGRTHATDVVLRHLAANVPALPDGGLTSFAQAMPVELMGIDSVAAYRRYYQTKRGGRLGTWRQNRPEWFLPSLLHQQD
jgi:hypothetical protein